MTRRVLAPLVALLLIAASAAPAQAAKRGCDPLGGKRCMLPWPNDWFTRHDGRTPTGLRLALPAKGMPANTSGKRIDPTDWNRADGFSPGQQITVFIRGLQTKEALSDNELPPVTDLDRVNFKDQRLLVIDARTGKRQLVWAELDVSAPAGKRALEIRPAKNLREGRRYVVALRKLETDGGKRIRPSKAFKAIRDMVKTKNKRIEARRRSMRPVFKALKRAKVRRHSLTLAWDFTVASRQSSAGPMLHMRDAAFAQLGDTDLGDLVPAGHSPAFTVTKVQDMTPEEPEIARVVEGTVTVPCYLESVACAVGAGFHRGPDGLPDQIAGNTYAAFFRCVIPRDMPAGGGRALLYGHGLLGSPLDSDDFAQSQLRTLAAQKKFTVCGTYWIGLSSVNNDEDRTQAALAIGDISKFGPIIDRLQQGMLNYLFLGRAMVATDGFRSHPAFAGAFDATQRLFYDGNSQGGIEGGSLTAIAPDFDRAVLGVTGMNYSTLLQRSVDFAPFRTLLDASYTDPVDRALIYSLLSNLWDRGEANGYAAHMTNRPLPNTPPHDVLMHVAVGDHQVAPVTAEVEARTIGARVWDHLDEGRSLDVDPFFAIPRLTAFPFTGSALIVFDSGPVTAANPQGTPPAPADDLPPSEGQDPHEFPRRTQESRDMKDQFLRVGGSLQTPPCGGGACYSNGYTGP